MNRTILVFSLAIFYATGFAQQKQFDALFKIYPDFSGVVLLADQGKPIYYRAFGYREFYGKKKLRRNDVFELASVTKQFTAMIIMMLKEKGSLDYDEPIEKYVDVPYRGITIRHLLTHTSGLPDYQEIMDKHWDKSKVAGNEDCIEYLNKYLPPMLFEPGEKYQYSNTGFLLLGSIAEKASGQDFIRLCQDWIFKPLKMKSTNIRTLEEKAATRNFAIGHILVKERGLYVRADSFPSSDYTIWLGNRKGPGRVSSTASDLLKWDIVLTDGKLVSRETMSEAFTPMKLNNGSLSNYGFGWMLKEVPDLGKVVYHTGSNPGYSTLIQRYTDAQTSFILLNNNAHSSFGEITQKMEAILIESK